MLIWKMIQHCQIYDYNVNLIEYYFSLTERVET